MRANEISGAVASPISRNRSARQPFAGYDQGTYDSSYTIYAGKYLLDRGASLPLILPATLLVFIFLVGPFYYMAYTAMTDLSFANPDQKGAFIGFDNFRRLVREDTIFWARSGAPSILYSSP
jgi:hypothetical protein